MGLFTKKCAYCGMALDSPDPIERMGKKFCSKEHAKKYWTYKKSSKGAHSGC